MTITVKNNAPFNGDNLSNSSPFERRQTAFRQLHNREVTEVFADVFDIPADGIPYDPSKITPKSSPRKLLKSDCLIDDADSFSEMWLKRELLSIMKDRDTPVILPSFDEVPLSSLSKPHVHLLFVEKKSAAIAARRRRVEALISFRIVEKTVTTFTNADLKEIEREINVAFPSSYILNKGRIKYSYRDKENGFEFILALNNEAEAKEIITKVLAVRDKTPDWDRLSASTSEKNFNLSKNITILGEINKLPKQRPIANCYLKSAFISFGKFKNVQLISRFV